MDHSSDMIEVNPFFLRCTQSLVNLTAVMEVMQSSFTAGFWMASWSPEYVTTEFVANSSEKVGWAAVEQKWLSRAADEREEERKDENKKLSCWEEVTWAALWCSLVHWGCLTRKCRHSLLIILGYQDYKSWLKSFAEGYRDVKGSCSHSEKVIGL